MRDCTQMRLRKHKTHHKQEAREREPRVLLLQRDNQNRFRLTNRQQDTRKTHTMNPKLCKRHNLPLGGKQGKLPLSPLRRVENDREKTSVQDAALLLSIADICKSEIRQGGMTNLWRDDLTLPAFPYLSESDDEEESANNKPKLPACRFDSARSFLSTPMATEQFYPANRVRAVSLDQTHKSLLEPDSPTTGSQQSAVVITPTIMPLASLRTRAHSRHHTSLRLSSKARKEFIHDNNSKRPALSSSSLPDDIPKSRRSKPLQNAPPKGLHEKKIGRKKFSWKNYPELEQFLIANRDEYLKHSALNYTVQQKSYNNRLTERLLELASDHGYMFDESEFSFVTVRDRIRCYYKSFVQSAKKRGVLMGYAARKAGLWTEDELIELGRDDGDIIMPSP